MHQRHSLRRLESAPYDFEVFVVFSASFMPQHKLRILSSSICLIKLVTFKEAILNPRRIIGNIGVASGKFTAPVSSTQGTAFKEFQCELVKLFTNETQRPLTCPFVFGELLLILLNNYFSVIPLTVSFVLFCIDSDNFCHWGERLKWNLELTFGLLLLGRLL